MVSALLLAHNLITTIPAFQWELALSLKQTSLYLSLSLNNMESGEFLDKIKWFKGRSCLKIDVLYKIWDFLHIDLSIPCI